MTYNKICQTIKQVKRQHLKELDLSNSFLTEIPPEVWELEWLENLNLCNNKLSAVPEFISRLTNLSQLNLSANQLTVLPVAIASLTNLSKLNLAHNQLTVVPEAIANLTNLSKLDLRGNRLIVLPEAISSLTNLNKLYLKGNPLTDPPIEIATSTKPIDDIREYFCRKRAGDMIYESKLITNDEDGSEKTTLAEKSTSLDSPLLNLDESTPKIDIQEFDLTMDNDYIIPIQESSNVVGNVKLMQYNRKELFSDKDKEREDIMEVTQNKLIKVKNAWVNGSFYLFVFVVVLLVIGFLGNILSFPVFFLVVIVGVLFIAIISILQLKQDEKLQDKTFLKSIKMVFDQLSLIGNMLGSDNSKKSVDE
ncbi:hypothetical protein BCD67_13385 [Oscillatoriales cyanobacterium USR001]|nr:hypothetical protein BCD67_13385 [Oscillatoriales cyanobacterium USR001]